MIIHVTIVISTTLHDNTKCIILSVVERTMITLSRSCKLTRHVARDNSCYHCCLHYNNASCIIMHLVLLISVVKRVIILSCQYHVNYHGTFIIRYSEYN